MLCDLKCNKKQFKVGRVSSGIESERNRFTLMVNGQKLERGYHRQSRKLLASTAPAETGQEVGSGYKTSGLIPTMYFLQQGFTP